MASLNVYTASAGAGKTYTLTLEYLSLALQQPEEKYRHILAMTFTNKATNEMKSRIIEELYQISQGNTENPLAQTLGERLRLEPEEVMTRAQRTLTAILGDYSAFHISTIDAFFQEVVRAFAFELNFGGNYKVEMDSDLWLHKATVLLLHSLDEKRLSDTRKWIYQLAEENLDQKGTNQIDRLLETLGRQLFAEAPLLAIRNGNFPSQEEIATARKAIQDYIKQFESNRYNLAEAFQRELSAHDIDFADLHGGSRSPFNYYKKILKNKNLSETIPQHLHKTTENLELLFPKKSDHRSKLNGLTKSSIPQILEDTIQLEKRYYIPYQTAKHTYENLNLLGTLIDLNNTMMQQGRETNTLLLSSTQQFIQQIIDNAETPFIYERLGTNLQHLMLDEFQDTARLQYDNLKPILTDCLASQGQDSLIVGDVKQSIYKFRNCDRHLLGSAIRRDFADLYKHHPLQHNWRSTPEVVRFNNAIFTQLPTLIEQAIQDDREETMAPFESMGLTQAIPESFFQEVSDCYAEVVQQISPKNKDKKGGIEIYRYPKEKADGGEDETPNALNITENIPHVILSLVENRGYKTQDIAILVNTNQEVTQVAECLINYSKKHPDKAHLLKFVSEEALKITNSPIIRFLIALLQALSEGARENGALFRMAEVHYELIIQKRHLHEGLPISSFADLYSSTLQQLPYLSLFDLVERTIGQLHPLIKQADYPYITTLLDQLYTFHCDEIADLHGFLEWWEIKGSKKTLPADESDNAISITTIHKSKGLGFSIVLLPFLEWDLAKINSRDTSYIWSQVNPKIAQEIGFSLSIVPLKLSKKLAQTYYAEEFYREFIDKIIDRLNLFYVAMTRAKTGLVLWLPEGKGNQKKGFNLDQLLNRLLERSDLAELLTAIPASSQKEEISSERKERNIPFPLAITTGGEQQHISIKLRGRQAYQENEAVRFGSTMHRLLSLIKTPTDLPHALRLVVDEGMIIADDQEKIQTILSQELARAEVAPWFAPDVEVLNEHSILLAHNRAISRPDRIVLTPQGNVIIIDYKFGEKQARYHKQVRRYMQLIQAMGYKSVQGFLWYFSDGNSSIEEVSF